MLIDDQRPTIAVTAFTPLYGPRRSPTDTPRCTDRCAGCVWAPVPVFASSGDAIRLIEALCCRPARSTRPPITCCTSSSYALIRRAPRCFRRLIRVSCRPASVRGAHHPAATRLGRGLLRLDSAGGRCGGRALARTIETMRPTSSTSPARLLRRRSRCPCVLRGIGRRGVRGRTQEPESSATTFTSIRSRATARLTPAAVAFLRRRAGIRVTKTAASLRFSGRCRSCGAQRRP